MITIKQEVQELLEELEQDLHAMTHTEDKVLTQERLDTWVFVTRLKKILHK